MIVTLSRIIKFGWQGFLRNGLLSLSTISIMILAAIATLGLLVGNMLGAPLEKLITLGAAVELLHTATLVHDDLIDGALLRRI